MNKDVAKPVIGISSGDLNGIGLEVIMKTFNNPIMLETCTPLIFASSKVISYHKKALSLDRFNFHIINHIDKLHHGKINLVNVWKEDVVLEFGKEDKEVGKYAFKSLEAACKYCQEGKIDALVTAPIHKNSIQSRDFQFSGHTDYLQNRFEGEATMMLAGPEMRMSLATVHIPLKEVSNSISEELILKKLAVIQNSLLQDFHIRKGKIAVLSLNPHAGDGGVIGKEDDEIVVPAIKQAFEKGIMAMGPYPADSFFGTGKHKKFDAILAMYHDQGLAPFKALSFGKGVNYTAGLNIIRTSPDHGTGFDIAGKAGADESSFREAVFLACDIVKKRKLSKKLHKNPLPVSSRNKED